MSHDLQGNGFTVSFSNQEVTAWGGMALFKRMLESLEFREAFARFGIPESTSNRGYPALQLIEQFIVSIWCGACRFAHSEVVRMDSVLCRLFGWPCAAEFKAIMRLFKRFDMLTNERVQMQMYTWLFGKLSLFFNTCRPTSSCNLLKLRDRFLKNRKKPVFMVPISTGLSAGYIGALAL